tara:strand:+ start:1574 stop:2797 length:1224 start_codon:yes stop_codon:yes gene_type:complete
LTKRSNQSTSPLHIHLDPVGGISGDMFIAAMLDCWPEYASELPQQMDLAGFGDLVKLQTTEKNDGVLSGTHFSVTSAQEHPHRQYSDIRAKLESSALAPEPQRIATQILHSLAVAESTVHGIPIEDVTFHEVGSWDSIADIVCAAFLIDQLGDASWSVSPLPLGRGQVQCAHGTLPIPAPAVTSLLTGFQFHDDGLEGERVTPTGAAILKYLNPGQSVDESVVTLQRSGFGFGTRQFPGISNVVRILTYGKRAASSQWLQDRVTVLQFEIDDQTPEELADGLDTIRLHPGVIDIIQRPALGKKGRQTSQVQILAKPDQAEGVMQCCFEQTTTLGMRKQTVDRAILPREEVAIQHEGDEFRVKLARRPSGEVTVKAEADDIASAERTQRERTRIRNAVETNALDQQHD